MSPARRFPPPRPRVADPGLQSERTYLAWQRTGLAFAAAGALLVHTATRAHSLLAAVPGGFGLAAGAAILLRGLLRYRMIEAAARADRDAASPGAAAVLAVAATLLTITGLIVVLTT